MTTHENIKKINLKVFYQNKLFLINLLFSVLINLATWLLLSLEFKAQSDPVILHYNIYFGIDLIGPWYRVYLMPLFGFICFFINFFLSVIIYAKEKLLSYFLVFISSLMQIILIIATIFIIFQNL
ncbi:MAG: hypothetical protein WC528_02265 [Patescibacteria group bacterium]